MPWFATAKCLHVFNDWHHPQCVNGGGKTALGLAVLANNFARLRNYLAADRDAVIRLLADAGGIE